MNRRVVNNLPQKDYSMRLVNTVPHTLVLYVHTTLPHTNYS